MVQLIADLIYWSVLVAGALFLAVGILAAILWICGVDRADRTKGWRL